MRILSLKTSDAMVPSAHHFTFHDFSGQAFPTNIPRSDGEVLIFQMIEV